MYPLFFDADAVRAVTDLLVRLLRVVFYRRRISTDDFVELHSKYWSHWRAGDNESTERNNMRRTLLDDKLTWRKFRTAIQDLLRLDLVRLSVTIRDPHTGELVTYHSDDTLEPEPAPPPPLPPLS